MSYLEGYGQEGDYLQTLFEQSWSTPIAWPNRKFTPPEADVWVRFNVRHSGADIASMGAPGANLRRCDGMVIVEIFVPQNKGDGDLAGHCDRVADVFRDHAEQQGLRFGEPYTVEVGERDGWYKRDVLVPFVRDTVFT